MNLSGTRKEISGRLLWATERDGIIMEKMRMRGAVLPGNSTVEMKEFEIPRPGYGQVLIC